MNCAANDPTRSRNGKRVGLSGPEQTERTIGGDIVIKAGVFLEPEQRLKLLVGDATPGSCRSPRYLF